MGQRILLGVDEGFSPPAQYALRVVGELFEQATPHFILLTVISIPYDPSPALMKAWGMGQLRLPAATGEQREQAQATLRRASALLQGYRSDLAPPRIDLVQRFGEPAGEVIKAAREHRADCIVLGHRGNSTIQNLRRICAGSISRDIMRLAPCPVVLVSLPLRTRPPNLAAWYEQAITRYLREQLDASTMFTPEAVTHMFVPSSSTSFARRKKLAAAAHALERLVRHEQLCCQRISGEMWYVHDRKGSSPQQGEPLREGSL